MELSSGDVLEGKVLDEEGRPIVGAYVRARPSGEGTGLEDSVARTDQTGHFRIGGLSAGEYVARATSEGKHASQQIVCRVPCESLTFHLASVGGVRVRVAVTDPLQAPEFVTCAQVWLGSYRATRARAIPWRTVSAKDGVVLRGFQAGACRLIVHASGFRSIVREFELAMEGETDLGVLDLEPAIDVRGRVVDSSGRSVPNARLEQVVDDWRSDEPTAQADARGRFVLTKVEDLDLLIRVRAAGHPTQYVVGRVTEAGDLVLPLQPSGTLRVLTLNSDGTHRSTISLRMWRHVGARRLPDRTTTTDATGRAIVELPAGTWTIGYGAQTRRVEIVAGEQQDVTIRLVR